MTKENQITTVIATNTSLFSTSLPMQTRFGVSYDNNKEILSVCGGCRKTIEIPIIDIAPFLETLRQVLLQADCINESTVEDYIESCQESLYNLK